MSGDIFADVCLASDVDDPDALIESSGVSGSVTTASQQSESGNQQNVPSLPLIQNDPSPGPSTSSAQPSSVSTICPLCNKTLQSTRGLKVHMTRSHKDHQGNISDTTTSTPTTSSSTTPTTRARSQKSSQSADFRCSECNTLLSTASGFLRHRASHKLQDIHCRLPDPSVFIVESLETVMDEILIEILEEPVYGDCSKTSVIQELINKKGTASYLELFVGLAEFVGGIVCKRGKVFPINQYEECLKKLNSYLNENQVILAEKLLGLCEAGTCKSYANRLVFRIAGKLHKKVHLWALKKMRNTHDSAVRNTLQSEMSDTEKDAFRAHIGDLLRSYFIRHFKLKPRQCECIKNCFVIGHQPMSRAQLLEKDNWFSGEEDCITLNDHTLDFFMGLEIKIIPAVKASKGDVTTQTVVEEILVNDQLLDDWFYLTNSYLTEDTALLFMRDLVSVFVKTSLLLEEKRSNRAEERSIRATSVALRTHLHHNLVEKDNNSENVE